MSRFTDQTILLTGAASGIGRAATLKFAAQGAKLFVTDVVAEGLEETVEAAELFEKSDERYLAQAADAIETQLSSLLRLFNIDTEIVWKAAAHHDLHVELDERLKTGPVAQA